MRSNADNLIGILQKSVDWHLENDYDFYPRKKDPVKYSQQADKFIKQIADIEANKDTYQATWTQQRTEKMKELEGMVEQIKK